MNENGILLEDKNVVLEWNKSVLELAKENNAKIIEQDDRIIINWGTHIILNGIKLELSNTYLLEKPDKFNFIESTFNGDDESFNNFNLIERHIEKYYGNPIKSEDDMEIKRDKIRIWEISNIKIKLYLFEIHAFRLNFTIEKI